MSFHAVLSTKKSSTILCDLVRLHTVGSISYYCTVGVDCLTLYTNRKKVNTTER